MSEWHCVKTTEDIDSLLTEYGGFHDSSIVEMNYKTGAYVDENGALSYGSDEEKQMTVIFHSQMIKKKLELCFIGVRQFSMAGWQYNYFSEIFDCYLKFHRDSKIDTPYIVWADYAEFSFNDIKLLQEPMTNFIIASNLKWRFAE